MANKLIRRVFFIVIFAVSVLVATLWFNYKHNGFLSSEHTQEAAPLFLNPDDSEDEHFESDEEEILLQGDEGESDAEELDASDLADAFESADFIESIDNDHDQKAPEVTFNEGEDFIEILPGT